jgi:hypothetical protein
MKKEHSAMPAAIMGIAFASVFGLVGMADPQVSASADAGRSDGAAYLPQQELEVLTANGNDGSGLLADADASKPTVRLAEGTKWPTDKRTLERLQLVAEDLGKDLVINSGKRDLGTPKNPKPGTQWYYWKRYQAGAGPLAAYPDPKAPHIKGYAADVAILQPDGTETNIGNYVTGRRLLRKHGLVLSVHNEAWHVAPEEVNSWAYQP